ncbi:MAG: 30S ribosomal protein S13 [Eubacteriales bacterium]|nr:30S ribosomal protein S13 [Eubacteriales bacterium]
MARIAGVDLPKQKRIDVALCYIYGIGPKTAMEILTKAGVALDIRVKDITEEEVGRIRHILEDGYKVEGELRAQIAANIKRLINIGSYRGLRHKKGLPVRGQNTRNNSRTRKGPKRTVGRKGKK